MAIFTFDGVGGGTIIGGGFKLAPDVNYMATRSASNLPYQRTNGINATGGLTTVLSLNGRFAIPLIVFVNMANGETLTVKLTVDNVVIINSSVTVSSLGASVVGGLNPSGSVNNFSLPIICEENLLLEVQITTDTSIDMIYEARPIA